MTIFANLLLMVLWFIAGGFVGYSLGADSGTANGDGQAIIGIGMTIILIVITLIFAVVQCVPLIA